MGDLCRLIVALWPGCSDPALRCMLKFSQRPPQLASMQLVRSARSSNDHGHNGLRRISGSYSPPALSMLSVKSLDGPDRKRSAAPIEGTVESLRERVNLVGVAACGERPEFAPEFVEPTGPGRQEDIACLNPSRLRIHAHDL